MESQKDKLFINVPYYNAFCNLASTKWLFAMSGKNDLFSIYTHSL